MRFMAILVVLLIIAGDVYAFKCDKCHRDDKALGKLIQEREIKTKEELFYLLRKGKFSKLHKNLTDQEISEASKILNLK